MIWLAVTSDKYQLPYAVADNVPELVEIIGATKDAVWRAKKIGTPGRIEMIIAIKD